MLLATPFIHIDKVLPKNGPPRIISEIRKPETGLNKDQGRSRLSGDLLVKCANEQQWWPRRVMIRGGQLLVGCAHGDVKSSSLRISLRHLSLSAGALPNSISLIRGQNVLLTMQAASERAFDLWVKSIAIELIRQTPLEDVKYLDILTIADCWNRKENDQEKDWNFNCLKENSPKNCNTCNQAYDSLIREKTDLTDSDDAATAKVIPKYVERVPVRTRSRSCNAAPKTEDLSNRKRHIQKQTSVQFAPKTDDESAVEVLIKKCQNPESYVPVKEKLRLFETLCRLGRKVRSSEDVSLKATGIGAKRARSLHDLHSFGGAAGGVNSGVREICKYFENKTDDASVQKFATVIRSKRLIFSDTSLNRLDRIKCRNLQNVSHA